MLEHLARVTEQIINSEALSLQIFGSDRTAPPAKTRFIGLMGF